MIRYIIRRLILMIPTLWAIMTINFFIVQAAPGGPVDLMLSSFTGFGQMSVTSMISNEGGDTGRATSSDDAKTKPQSSSTGSRYAGLDPELIAYVKKMYGFDKPMWQRYLIMLKDYLTFNLGESYFREIGVLSLVIEKLPVSVSLGLWSTLIVYAISIPLGIAKAKRHQSRFDTVTSTIVVLGNAIPSFMLALLLIILFAGGTYWNIFPLRGLVSDDFSNLSLTGKILDYAHHLVLPTIAMVVGSFASLTMLTKNSFLDELNKPYVMTARAKGLTERQVLYKHVFRNAMLIIIAAMPAAFIGVLLTGSLLIEIMFSLDGLGFMSYKATLARDFPIIFGTLYIFTILGMVVGLISDLMYTVVDKRINFEASS